MTDIFGFCFWISVLGVTYTFLGYPVVIWWLSTLPKKASADDRDHFGITPSVTVVLVVRNEGARVAARIANLLESDYPSDRLDVLVVSDGSTDETAKQVLKGSDQRVRLVSHSSRAGKAACLNRAAQQVTADLIVFADARQRFAGDTISRLAAWFEDDRIGAVSGNLSIEPSASSTGKGVDAYWRMERLVREWESRIDSSIGCTGAVYAVRRSAFEAIPEDTILDDVVIPMRITLQGYRVIFDGEARAFDPQPLEPEKERVRKRRTLAGNLQMLVRYPSWLLPWRNRLCWQLISHKYLRLFAPFWLAAMLLSSLFLARRMPYSVFFSLQVVGILLGIAGLWFRRSGTRWLSVPAGFLFLNSMVVEAWWRFVFGSKMSGWETIELRENTSASAANDMRQQGMPRLQRPQDGGSLHP